MYNTEKQKLQYCSSKLLRVVKFSVMGISELLNVWQNLSTVAYKPVAFFKKIVYLTLHIRNLFLWRHFYIISVLLLRRPLGSDLIFETFRFIFC